MTAPDPPKRPARKPPPPLPEPVSITPAELARARAAWRRLASSPFFRRLLDPRRR